MNEHVFEPTSSANKRSYFKGIPLSFEAARTGALSKHDFLDVTMADIEIQVAGGSECSTFQSIDVLLHTKRTTTSFPSTVCDMYLGKKRWLMNPDLLRE